MGYGVLIIGDSGAGKSTSLRNFDKNELSLVNVCGKPLPFRGSFANTLRSDNYNEIFQFVQNVQTKAIAIDDCQYLLANEFMRRCRETGYAKFTDIAERFWSLIRLVDTLSDDTIVYFLGHTATGDDGKQRFKTVGKLLDEKITIEGLFTMVLHAISVDGNYYFTTQARNDTAKSPIGLFDEYLIPNDLKAVDEALRAYYGFQNAHHCADCGEALMPVGETTVEQLVKATFEVFGRKLCAKCAKRASMNQ